MMGYRYFWVLVFLGLVAGGVMAQEAPAWALDTEVAYPQDRFIAARGSGQDLNLARQDGLTQLAQYFGVDISVFSEGSKLLQSTATSSSLETKIAETVKIRVNQDLFGVRYSAAWFTGRSVEVIAYIDRAELGQELADVASRLGERLTRLLAMVPEDSPTILARALAVNVLLGQIDVALGKYRLVDRVGARALEGTLPLDESFELWTKVRTMVPLVLSARLDGPLIAPGLPPQALAKLGDYLTAQGFVVRFGTLGSEPSPELGVNLVLRVDERSLNTQFKTLAWQVSIAIADQRGTRFLVHQDEGRVSGTTVDSGLIQVGLAMDRMVKGSFAESFQNWLGSLVR